MPNAAKPSAAPPAAVQAATWGSRATASDVVERLRAARRAVILTHSKPDGDAIGSTLAVARSLIRLGAHATVLYVPPWQPRMDVLLRDTPALFHHARCWDDPRLANPDTVVICDTGSWSQLAEVSDFVRANHDRALVIDHHARGDADVAPLRHVETACAAACEVAAPICCALLGVAGPRHLPQEIAEPLYLGLGTDTGWFRYSNASASVHRMAADLLDAGADHISLYALIEQSDEVGRLVLIRKALESLQLFDDDRIAVMTLMRNDIRAHSGEGDHVSGLTELTQSIASVRATAMITELEDGGTKVSFRSKAGAGEIDVNKVAQTLGGGGHFHAAGAKMKMPLAQAKPRIINALINRGA